jgi:transcriptional regulator with XRE-family HTH domain
MGRTNVGLAGVVGARIKAFRTRKGLSASQLAGLSDLDATFLNHLEAGRKLPSLATLLRLAEGLGVQPGELLGRGAVPTKGDSLDQLAVHQVRALVARRNPAEKRKLVELLRLLANPRRVEALLNALKR